MLDSPGYVSLSVRYHLVRRLVLKHGQTCFQFLTFEVTCLVARERSGSAPTRCGPGSLDR